MKKTFQYDKKSIQTRRNRKTSFHCINLKRNKKTTFTVYFEGDFVKLLVDILLHYITHYVSHTNFLLFKLKWENFVLLE